MRRFASGASASALVLLLATCRVDRITQPPPRPILTLSPFRLLDSAAVGSLAGRGGTVDLTNAGPGTLSWTARTVLGASWLRVSPASGTAPTALRISLVPDGLAPGVYRDTVVVSAEDTEGSPALLPVEFVIHPCVVQAITLDAQLPDSVTLNDCAVPHGAGRLGRLYSFTASAGDSISVFMTSSAFTGHVVLDSSTAAGAAPLAEGGHLRYQLLANSGTFVIEATTAAPAQAGAFILGVFRPRSPEAADSLRQFGVDSTSAVAVGGSVDHAAVVLRGSLRDPDGDSLRLEVELRPTAEPITDTATAASARVSNGGRAFVAVHGLAEGTPYHWQARVVDQTGRASPWLPFGGNGGNVPDFSIVGDVATQIAVEAGSDQSATVATAVATPPSVIVRDQFNNPVAGVPVTFLVTAGDGSIDPPTPATTNASGIAAATRWILGATAGPNTVTATARGSRITGNPAEFAATGTAGPATALAITTPPSATVQSGIAFPQQPVVQLVDAYGNPAPQGETAIKAAIATGNPALSGTNPVVTTAAGTAAFTDLTVTGATGPRTMIFAATALLPAASSAVIVATGIATQIAVHDGNHQAGSAGDAVAIPPSVIVKDASGNPVAGVPVTFAVASGEGTVNPATAVTTDSSGIATVTSWTLGTTAGANALTATATGIPGSPVTFTATGTPGAATQLSVHAGDTQSATVGTAVATPPAVLVRDSFDNPVPGVAVTFAVASGEGTVNPAIAVTTDSSGVATVETWTLGTVAGPHTLTAVASGLTGSPVVFEATATAGAPAADRSLVEASPTTLTASSGSSAATVTVTVRDVFGNLVSGATVTLAATGAGNALTQPPGPTDASGQVTGTLSSTRAEAKTISATVNDAVPIAQTAAATVTHAAAAVIAGTAGTEQAGYVEEAVETPPAVVVTDEFGNPVSGEGVTFAVASGGGSVSPTSDVTTGADGIAATTSWTLGPALGPNTLTATSAGVGGSPVTFTAMGTLPPVPDPTLLPPASGQARDDAAYAALNVPSQAAGFSYSDPMTGIRIWKVTSGAVPESNIGAGHDYADGGNQVSRGWGPGNNTHTILILTFRGPGDFAYHLVDFTRDVGLSNYRLLTVQPRGDLAATFSSLRSQPRILYILTATQLVRYNTETMQTENTGNFPLAITADAWLHQDKSDAWFVGLTENETAFAWNSQTNELLTQSEPWLDEPRLDRDGRYVVLSATETVRLWDLTTNTLGPTQVMDPGTVGPSAAFWFGHIASLRGRWVTANPNATVPAATDRYYVSGGAVAKVEVLGNSFGHLMHQAGNWIQYDAELGGDLDRQWAYGTGYGADDPRFAWRHAVGLVRADGSDSRLLLHHYSSDEPEYYASPWGMPSPDGKVVIFNSDMLGSGRWDLFIAAMPIRFP